MYRTAMATVANLDAAVIGSGPAGQRAAQYLAERGRQVAIISPPANLGSVKLSLSTGAALPFFTFREAVLHLSGQRQAAFQIDRPAFVQSSNKPLLSRVAIQDRIERVAIWSNETSMARLRASGVRVIHGLASFLDPHTLKVIDNANQAITVKAKSFIIASGSCNDDDDTIPHDERLVINCDSLLRTTNWSIPKRPIMIGANSQGIEYASTLASLVGVAVTVIDRRTEILDDVDSDMRQRLIDDMKLRLTTFKLGCTVSSVVVDREANDVVVTCDDGTILRSDLVIFTGKKVGNTAGLGLQDVLGADSIDKRGFIRVNKDMQTAQPHIYAVGNVIADTGISYRSSQQGMEAACHIVGDCVRIRAQDDELIPHTINSIPLISRVGPTDEALRRAGRPFVSGFADFHELAKGLMLQRKGYMKLSVCPITHKLLAVHTFGTSANELVHIGQVVVANNGTVNTLINNIWNYPSFAEAYRVAAFNALAKCQK